MGMWSISLVTSPALLFQLQWCSSGLSNKILQFSIRIKFKTELLMTQVPEPLGPTDSLWSHCQLHNWSCPRQCVLRGTGLIWNRVWNRTLLSFTYLSTPRDGVWFTLTCIALKSNQRESERNFYTSRQFTLNLRGSFGARPISKCRSEVSQSIYGCHT